MTTNSDVWGDASVSYPDWSGTAQLDQRVTGKGLEEIVGLDRSEWMVIGLDLGGGEHTHNLRVVAIPRPSGRLSEMAEQAGGELRATEFLVHDVDPYEVLRQVTHVFELRLRVSGCENFPIRIVAEADVPEQDE